MHRIKVVPLAAESLGVRSMCTYVETPSLRILLDAGVSLAPNRFGLPPHPREFHAIAEARARIADHAAKADVVTISHYHFDHHTPSYEDWLCHWTDAATAQQVYAGKLVLAKEYRAHVNASQRRRGWVFAQTGGKHAKKLESADGKAFAFGETEVTFSRPVFHGPAGTPLGWLIMTTLKHADETMVFASDVQGPMDVTALQMIMAEQPQLLVVGGPPLYLVDYRVDARQLKTGFENLATLARAIPTVILEHHLLRDLTWREAATPVFSAAQEAGNSVVSAAEFLGEDDRLLEAQRRQLFSDTPPSKAFDQWSKLPELAQRSTKPPV